MISTPSGQGAIMLILVVMAFTFASSQPPPDPIFMGISEVLKALAALATAIGALVFVIRQQRAHDREVIRETKVVIPPPEPPIKLQ